MSGESSTPQLPGGVPRKALPTEDDREPAFLRARERERETPQPRHSPVAFGPCCFPSSLPQGLSSTHPVTSVSKCHRTLQPPCLCSHGPSPEMALQLSLEAHLLQEVPPIHQTPEPAHGTPSGHQALPQGHRPN